MKISTEFKPEFAAGEGQSDYDPDFCYLDLTQPKEPVLVSTNGRIMTVLPVITEADDAEGPLPLAALVLARENTGTDLAYVDAGDPVGVPSIHAKFDRPDGPFPNWRKAIPSLGSKTVVINAFLLMAVIKAMGATEDHPRVTLNFEPGESGTFAISITRQSRDYQTVRGFLMTAREL